MSRDSKIRNLEQLLQRIESATKNSQRVSLRAILDEVGRRSFGPLLLLAGVIAVAPVVGDIPGVPTLVGILVFLVTIQLLFGRKDFWFPRWLLERSVARDKLLKAIKWLRRPAQFIDRLLRPRLTRLTEGAASYAMAIASLIIALGMPAMEVVPFSANFAGAALTAFGLALIAHDGLLALLAFLLTAGTIGLILHHFITG